MLNPFQKNQRRATGTTAQDAAIACQYAFGTGALPAEVIADALGADADAIGAEQAAEYGALLWQENYANAPAGENQAALRAAFTRSIQPHLKAALNDGPRG